jgi:hypothetical protein
MSAIALIAAVNTLLTLAAEAGISWTRLRAAIDKAKAEGRQFDLSDIEAAAAEADQALAKLREAIAAAKQPHP